MSFGIAAKYFGGIAHPHAKILLVVVMFKDPHAKILVLLVVVMFKVNAPQLGRFLGVEVRAFQGSIAR